MKNLINISLFRKNRDFRWLFGGHCVSFIGTMITGVALPFQVYHETQSTLMVGLISLFQLLPLLLTALLGGALADRHHRRKMLLITDILLSVGCLLLMANSLFAKPSIPFIFIIAAMMSGLFGLYRPALTGLTQQIVNKEDYAQLAVLSNMMFSLSLIIGPAIAGLLIAHFGVAITFFVDFVTYAFSLVTLLMIREMPKPTSNPGSTWSSLKEGFNYAFSRQELVGTYVIDFVAMIFGMPMALFPAIAHQHGGPKALGILYSTPAVGSLLISLYSGWTNRIKRQGVAIAFAASIWGVAIIVFGLWLKQNFFIALVFLAIAGAADAVSGIFRSTLWNQTIPTELRGRLSGIEMISFLSGPKLGDTEAGLVAAAFGITISIVSGGILCVVGVGVCCYFLPKFWRYTQTE